MNKYVSILTITLAWFLPISLDASYKGKPTTTDILQATNARLTKISSEAKTIYDSFNEVAESIEYLHIPGLSYQDLKNYVEDIKAKKKSLSELFKQIVDKHKE